MREAGAVPGDLWPALTDGLPTDRLQTEPFEEQAVLQRVLAEVRVCGS